MSADPSVTEAGARLPRPLRWLERRASGAAGSAGDPLARKSAAAAGWLRLPRHPLQSQRALLFAWVVLTDTAALVAAFGAAYWIRFNLQLTTAPEVLPPKDLYLALSGLLILLWLLVFAAFKLYDPHARSMGTVESPRVLHACTMAAVLVIVSTFLVPTFVISRVWLIAAWAFSFLLVAANRFLARRVVRALRGRGYLLAPAVIVGTNEEAASLAAFLHDWRASGVRAVGLVSTGDHDVARDVEGRADMPLLGPVEDIARIVTEHSVEDVIVAITSASREELLQLCEDVDTLPVELRLSSGLYEMLTTRVTVRTLGTVPLMSLQKSRLDPKEAAFKNGLDKSLALVGLLFLMPVLLAIAAAIKLDSRGPVIYRRRVLGVGGRQFDAFKFRTMVLNGENLLKSRPGAEQELASNHKLKDDPRVTAVGRWLRRYSLDEFPQLVNVLLGQMSLVGPRMITMEEAEKYGRHRMNLLTVKPGITGLWQVSGRSDLSYEERVRIDMYYVRTYSVWLDLQILFIQTPTAVLKGRGAY